jgi:hypothetical protein
MIDRSAQKFSSIHQGHSLIGNNHSHFPFAVQNFQSLHGTFSFEHAKVSPERSVQQIEVVRLIVHHHQF